MDDLVGKRMVFAQFAALDPGQQADGADRVFVHGIVVIHVELHLRVDAAEFGDEPAENARLVEGAQGLFGVAAAGEQFHEQRVGALGSVRRSSLISTSSRAIRRMVSGWISSPSRSATTKISIRRTGSSRNQSSAGRCDAPAEDLVAFHDALLGAKTCQQPARLALGELLVQLGQEHAGEVADHFGLQEEHAA